MAEAEDMLEYIDYYQEKTTEADSGEALAELMARYEKGVHRNADGRVISGKPEANLQADDRDVSDAAGGYIRGLDTPEQVVQQA
jgi:hypothetical protein